MEKALQNEEMINIGATQDSYISGKSTKSVTL